jgi:hypothetical protein
MNRAARLLVLLVLLPLLIAGCGPKDSDAAAPADPAGTSADAAPIDGSCPTSNTIAFAKTKFVLHSGLAFGAFHRYLYKPYKAGTFSKGADGRITAMIKGGLAALFVKREVRLATEDVKANPTLCKAIAAPLAKLGDGIQNAWDKLKSGDPSGIEDANSLVSNIESTSGKSGVEITENEDADLTSTPG